MQVVNLGGCRELLKAWDRVRTEILKGEYDGMTVCMHRWDGESRMFMAGETGESAGDAAKAALRLSWEITQEVDFQSSRM